MACKAWQESEEGVREFMEGATEDQACEALQFLFGMAERYIGASRATAARLTRLARLLERLGTEKFGPDFSIPF